MFFRWVRRIALALLVLVVLAAGGLYVLLRWRARPNPAIAPQLSKETRDAENARLTKLGLKLPPDGILLERPFEAPWSSRSMVVPASWIPPGLAVFMSRDRKVPADAVLRDLDVLEGVMSRAYGGWASAEASGWNWARWFERWRKSLRARGSEELSLDEAFAPIDELFASRVDNHTQIPLQRLETGSVSQSAQLEREPSGPCDLVRNTEGKESPLSTADAGQQPRRALGWNDPREALQPVSYLALPSRRGTLAQVHCGGEWIPLRTAAGPRGTSARAMILEEVRGSNVKPELRRLSETVAYARVPSMNPATYASFDPKARPLPTGKEKLLIVDVRGNTGGSSGYGWQVIDGWVDEKRAMKFEDMGSTLTESCLYAPLKWNFTMLFTGGGAYAQDEEGRKELQEWVDQLTAPGEPGCPRRDKEHPPAFTWLGRKPQPEPERMRILLVTDNACGSDCEFLTRQLGSLPETVVVGVNTAGVSQFIQPGYGILPHSRLPFRIALGESNSYGDHRSVDGHGLDVDVLLTREDDWSEASLIKLAEVLPAALQKPVAAPSP